MSDIELAWAAGFFDGEGSVSRNRNQPVLVVGQTGTTEHLERFIRAVGVGRVLGPYKGTGFSSRPAYRWQVYGEKARVVMTQLRPYLCSPKVAKYDAWFGEELI